MKALKLTALAMLVVATAYATDKNNDEKKLPKKVEKKTVAVINNSEQIFKLVYLEKSDGIVKVALKNEKGELVHNQTIKNSDGFAQPYNLENLNDGEYSFEITNPDGTTVKENIIVEKPSANFAADVLDVNDNKKFRLAIVYKDQAALPTSVKIYNEKDDLIYSETAENLRSFRKVYDLKDVYGDSFRFVISNKSGTKFITMN